MRETICHWGEIPRLRYVIGGRNDESFQTGIYVIETSVSEDHESFRGDLLVQAIVTTHENGL